MQALSGMLAVSCLTPAYAETPVSSELCAETFERFGKAFDRAAPGSSAPFASLSDSERYRVIVSRLEMAADWLSAWNAVGLIGDNDSEPTIRYSRESKETSERDTLALANDDDRALDDFGVLDRMERCMVQAGAFDPVAKIALAAVVSEEERIVLRGLEEQLQ